MVSIIVPVYNVEQYLDECIASIVNQTYKDIEVILVDDGSKDRSPEICDEWAKKDVRIKVIHKENQGPSMARNVAIEQAEGDYLLFVDSDDYIASDLCEKTVAVAQEKSADVVVFGHYRIENGCTTAGYEADGYSGFMEKEEVLKRSLLGNILDYSVDKLFRKKIFENVRYPIKHRCFEDVGTLYKAYLNAKTFFFLPDCLYYYRKREGSITSDMTDNQLRDCFVMRHQKYTDIIRVYPNLSECGLLSVHLAALRLIDRSFWSKVDQEELARTKELLKQDRNYILQNSKQYDVKMYCSHPKLYQAVRLGKHFIGNIYKKLRGK